MSITGLNSAFAFGFIFLARPAAMFHGELISLWLSRYLPSVWTGGRELISRHPIPLFPFPFECIGCVFGIEELQFLGLVLGERVIG
jgi:hypothetical protein